MIKCYECGDLVHDTINELCYMCDAILDEMATL